MSEGPAQAWSSLPCIAKSSEATDVFYPFPPQLEALGWRERALASRSSACMESILGTSVQVPAG
ncbi:hypothetical protein DNTS_017815 [Danionella cerebrum]|uniref:Uncharacterized protein n=1 Tax=Danionella cerebrum TaxID=2873325 RepID=A0A553R063_9TELE|nr:hypothetical protein DNTS_017815 [Danionella translucida]